MIPRWKRLKRRDWKNPFNWFEWASRRKKEGVLFRMEAGRTWQNETFSRADSTTCAHQRGADGIWRTVPANVKRDNHYPLGSSMDRHVLLEPSRVNSALGACSCGDTTYWGNTGPFTLAAATSCIAGQVATKHTCASAVDSARYQNVGTFVNGQTDTLSWIVENVDALVSRFEITDLTAGATAASVTITWANGTIATTGTPAGSGLTLLNATGPNGGALYHVWVAFTGTAAGTGANGNTRRVFGYLTGTLATTLSAIHHHAQFEANAAFPTSPIVTVGSAVTRAVDAFYAAPRFAPMASSYYVKFVERGTVQIAGARVWQLCDSGSNNSSIRITANTAKYTAFLVDSGGSTISTSDGPAGPAYNDTVELLVTITSAGVVTITQALNGAAGTAGASGAAGGLPTTWGASGTPNLYLNSRESGTGVGCSAIQKYAAAAGVLTMAQARTL